MPSGAKDTRIRKRHVPYGTMRGMDKSDSGYRVGLVDCNNFFVSCERLFRPDLRKRPVVVLSSNDGCVVARSQEVKDIGIPMGVPYFQIKDTIKDNAITVFSSNFTLYRDISRRVFSTVRDICPAFEQYSIDEGFFLVREVDAESVAWNIKDTVARTLGMPVSVGLAASKTLAKYASVQAKRGPGVYLMSDVEWGVRAPRVELGELWGVGPQRRHAFADAGITTAGELLSADLALVRRRFGVEGVRLQLELSGVRAYPLIRTVKMPQSIMHSRSFRAPTRSQAVVEAAVSYHIQRGVEDLLAQGLCAQFLTVSIRSSRHEKWAPGWGSETVILTPPTADIFTMVRTAHQVVERLFQPDVRYQKAGIILTGLMPAAQIPAGTLWDYQSPQPQCAVVGDVVSALKSRFGSSAVQVGYYASTDSWQARAEARSPAYTTRWAEVVRARAL